jgi:hypothetical protein
MGGVGEVGSVVVSRGVKQAGRVVSQLRCLSRLFPFDTRSLIAGIRAHLLTPQSIKLAAAGWDVRRPRVPAATGREKIRQQADSGTHLPLLGVSR